MVRSEGFSFGGGSGGSTGGGLGGGAATPKPSNTRKLACPCCNQSVRATKAVNILCGNCMERMVEV